jgi:ubiquitin-conjugating enzyme E2 O
MPYFNEPGFEASANTAHGQQRATDYNDKTFLLSCKTMLYSLRRPPEVNLLMQQIKHCCCLKPCWPTNHFFACVSLQHFADLVAGHFRVHGHTILAACKYYLEGNAIGSAVPEDKEESDCFGDTGASSSNEAPKAVTSAFGSSRFGAFKCTDTDGWGPHIRLHSGDKFRGPRSITSRVNLLNKRFVFNASLKTLFELLMEFNVKGVDTRKFIAEKLKKKTTCSLRCAGRGFRNASN